MTQYKPHPDYPFWLYDPEGNGMTYYKTAEERDKAGAQVVAGYLDDAWHEEVDFVSAGTVTHFAQCLNKQMRPPDEELDDSQCDEAGSYWGDYAWKGNYELTPIHREKNRDPR